MGPLSNTFEAITFAWNWKPGTEEGTPSVCAVVWEAIGIPKVNRCGANSVSSECHVIGIESKTSQVLNGSSESYQLMSK